MKHPVQYQVLDKREVNRFVENKLVSWLIDQLPNGLNSLSMESHSSEYDDADYDQILQQIGYSVSGVPFRNHELYGIVDGDIKPDENFEEKYLALKEKMLPIVADMFNKHEDDLR